MSSRWQGAKREVARVAREMAARGLVTGSSGNVSVRLEPQGARELLAITPAGKSYDALVEDGIVVVDFDVEPVEGDLAPSSESLLHTEIYRRRPDVGAVIHVHPVYCSVAAVAGLEIPPIIDEMVVRIGGAVALSGYAFPGTQDLADKVCAALGERMAALIRNHGAVGVGRDAAEALDICLLTERAAQVYVFSSLLGKVDLLPPDVVDAEVLLYRMGRRARR